MFDIILQYFVYIIVNCDLCIRLSAISLLINLIKSCSKYYGDGCFLMVQYEYGKSMDKVRSAQVESQEKDEG